MRRHRRNYWLSLCLALSAMHATPAVKPPGAKPELPTTGVNLSRPEGGWINVEVVEHRFVVRFFDNDKKPAPVAIAGGTVRFIYTVKVNKIPRLPLNPSEDYQKLVSPAKVLPPPVFHVHIALFTENSAQPLESYNFRYPG